MTTETKKFLKMVVSIYCFAFVLTADVLNARTTSKVKYPVLILDSSGDPKLPEHFRTSLNPYPKDTANPPPRLGLDTLNVSGSGQFTGANLIRMLKEINASEGYIVDLRKESHGFLDSTPVSWYGFRNLENKDRNPGTVESAEKNALSVLDTQRKAIVFQKNYQNGEDSFSSRRLSFRDAKTEKALVKSQPDNTKDFQYVRFFVLDHYPPDISQIDAFVEFVKTLNPGAWLHFHSYAGKMRTTTFMVLYDIIRNANQVSLESILKRQALIGGSNFLNTSDLPEWKIPIHQKRMHIIQSFYNYVKDPEGYEKRSFSEWSDYIEGKVKKKGIFSVIGF